LTALVVVSQPVNERAQAFTDNNPITGLEDDLREALQTEQLQVHFQPIVTLEDGRIGGFEALVRWPHPKYGSISPADFVPLAEETGPWR
jgi:sensor c-di-GMP phosphodiesterase-like protein